jgi:glycosyltransferase involved in cell wall biosynthesis
LVLHGLFRNATGLYVGSNNHDFFQAYGVAEDRLFPAPYCVDNHHLQEEAQKLAPERAHIRQRWGLHASDPVILYVGKLTRKKSPLVLLEAFDRVYARHQCQLLVVGEGPLEAEMKRQVADRRLEGVVFAGFLNRSEISSAYAAADVFCLPSVLHETWGIVVNEAMNFSLPVVVSDKVGSARDLVHSGRNGAIVPSEDAGALAMALEELVADGPRRRRYGRESLEIISSWNVESAAEGIVAAARSALGWGASLQARGVAH